MNGIGDQCHDRLLVWREQLDLTPREQGLLSGALRLLDLQLQRLDDDCAAAGASSRTFSRKKQLNDPI